MAERLKTDSQQKWECRNFCTLGPKLRVDGCNPQMGIDGTNVYSMYGVTDSGDQNHISFTEGGNFRILTDRSIELTAGNKSENEGFYSVGNSYDICDLIKIVKPFLLKNKKNIDAEENWLYNGIDNITNIFEESIKKNGIVIIC